MQEAAGRPTNAELTGGADVLDETMRRLSDAAGVTVWTWYPANDAVTRVGGTRRIDPNRNSFENMLSHTSEADRPRMRQQLRAAVRSGQSGSLTFRTTPELGSRIVVITFFPLEQRLPVERLQVIAQDVTQAVQTEQALRESIDHYRTAVDLNPGVPWLASPDGKIIEVGRRWEELAGMSAEDTLGDGWLLALHPEDVEPTLRRWAISLQSGEPVDLEYRLRLASGEYRWMRARAAARRDDEGRIIRWYGALEDVHEKRQTEAALRDSEEFSRSILESSTMAMEVLDAEGRLIFINGPGIRIMEIPDVETIRHKPYDSFWPPDVAPAVRYAISEARKGNTVRRTLYGPTQAGAPKWWDLSISPIFNAKGEMVRLLALSSDVTDAKRNEAEVAAAARRLGHVLESTMDCVVSVDSNWRISYMNRRAVAFFPGDGPYVGSDFREFIDAEEGSFLDRYRLAMREQRSIAFEDYLPSTKSWLEVQAFGSGAGLIVFFRDVTERRLAQEQIVHLARHDSLTGLPNRLHFHDALGDALLAAQADSDTSLALLAVDLDDFKLINDTMGHRAGDTVLEEVAQRLRAVSNDALVARLGGDEFALFMPVAHANEAQRAARRIIRALCEPFVIDGESVEIGASVGIAIAPRDGRNADALLHHADIALYRVKGENGGAFRQFSPEMDQALRERREMKRELSLALSREELSLVYQPQMEICSNRLIGFEALLRWNSPTRGAVSPAMFIPLAEESGLIQEIGAFVLRRATADAVHWPESIKLAVNLSPAQFRSGAVLDSVHDALKQSGLAPRRLELEITESVLLEEAAGAIGVLESLHAAGMRVALDDFGTGYSSLSYLQRFHFDKIKIDRSFVAGLPVREGSMAIVRSIIGLGRSLQTRVTAEGVESFEQLMFLADEGCDEAQGYLFSQPLPAAQALALALTRGQPAAEAERRRG